MTTEREILEQRARALARPPAEPAPASAVRLLRFSQASEAYAIEPTCVLDVFRLEKLALVPAAEPPLLGVTVWRGEVLTVVDLRALVLGKAAAEAPTQPWVLVLGPERPPIGILADELPQLFELDWQDVHEPGPAARADLVRGVTRDAVLVLDGAALAQVQA